MSCFHRWKTGQKISEKPPIWEGECVDCGAKGNLHPKDLNNPNLVVNPQEISTVTDLENLPVEGNVKPSFEQ